MKRGGFASSLFGWAEWKKRGSPFLFYLAKWNGGKDFFSSLFSLAEWNKEGPSLPSIWHDWMENGESPSSIQCSWIGRKEVLPLIWSIEEGISPPSHWLNYKRSQSKLTYTIIFPLESRNEWMKETHAKSLTDLVTWKNPLSKRRKLAKDEFRTCSNTPTHNYLNNPSNLIVDNNVKDEVWMLLLSWRDKAYILKTLTL